LLSYLRDKLDGTQFFLIAQLHQRALACESRFKETSKSVARTIHLTERDSSDDESTDVYTAEFIWPTKAKSSACSSLQPVQKNQQEEIKFTFNVAKCDKIFDELLKNGNIKLTHTIPPIDELKRRAYCKWHNSFSHATNNCNVFRRQVQSAINEGWLAFQEMQVDTHPFPINTIDVACEKVLVRREMADKGKGKGIVIGDPRMSIVSQKEIARKASEEKAKKSEGAGGQTQLRSRARQPDLSIADGPTPTCGQSGAHKDGPAGSARQSAHGQRRQPPYKALKGKRRKGKAHMVG
jgi:hypothetical protein